MGVAHCASRDCRLPQVYILVVPIVSPISDTAALVVPCDVGSTRHYLRTEFSGGGNIIDHGQKSLFQNDGRLWY